MSFAQRPTGFIGRNLVATSLNQARLAQAGGELVGVGGVPEG
jgi:hypothetical protein